MTNDWQRIKVSLRGVRLAVIGDPAVFQGRRPLTYATPWCTTTGATAARSKAASSSGVATTRDGMPVKCRHKRLRR
ncbi:hypothetical protein ABZ817_41345, partial [Streptomyces antimycoticus]